MYFSGGDSRFWWFSGSIKPFWGLTPCTRSHFSRERRSQYPFVEKPSIRPSKIDLLQIARQSLQGVPKSEINCSGGEDPPTPGGKRDFSIFLKNRSPVLFDTFLDFLTLLTSILAGKSGCSPFKTLLGTFCWLFGTFDVNFCRKKRLQPLEKITKQ